MARRTHGADLSEARRNAGNDNVEQPNGTAEAVSLPYGGVSFVICGPAADRTMPRPYDPRQLATAPAGRVTVSREVLREGDTLGLHVVRMLMAFRRDLPEFRLLDLAGSSVEGHPAVRMHFVWTTPMGKAKQTVLVVHPRADPDGAVTVVSISALVGRRQSVDDALTSVLENPAPTAVEAGRRRSSFERAHRSPRPSPAPRRRRGD